MPNQGFLAAHFKAVGSGESEGGGVEAAVGVGFESGGGGERLGLVDDEGDGFEA